MARICKTLPGPESTYGPAYNHRSHRSKRGQKKRKMEDRKTPLYFAKAKKEEEILEKTNKRLPSKKELMFEWTKQYDDDGTPIFINNKKIVYPTLLCENCTYANRLDFAPLKDPERLSVIICQECQQPAYYAHYWKNFELMSMLQFIVNGWLREMVHTKKARLLDLI